MEIDLDHHQPPHDDHDLPFRAQVCVVGAGIAGLTLAHRLMLRGVDVILLEAGGLILDDPADPASDLFAEAQLLGQPHLGTTEGRSRVFGGSSLRWGGQVLPLPPLHYVPSPVPHSVHLQDAPTYSMSGAWPLAPDTLTPFYCAAEELLDVDRLPFDAATFFSKTRCSPPSLLAALPGLTFRLSKWAPFDHRNFAGTFAHDLLANPRLQVYLHAQVTELQLAPARDRLEAIHVRTSAGNVFRFVADHFVLAAGTVETARLLLASRSVAPEGVGNANDQVGRNFHDHLTLTAATLTGPARSQLLREFRPWIFGPTLHSLKLEASLDLRRQLGLNPVLAHFTLQEPEETGLAVVRRILHARQRGDLLATLRANASRLPAALIEAFCLAWSARFQHRRFVSADTVLRLQLNAAQDAPSTSRITLSPDLDRFGLPEPVVDWRITPNEIATLRSFASHLRSQLSTRNPAGLNLDGIAWLPELFPQPGLSANDAPLPGIAPIPGLEDARHAMGGACMGLDPRSSVVDTDLQVHGLANLSIASAATFPTGIAQLPTLSLMALALRLADRLATSLGH